MGSWKIHVRTRLQQRDQTEKLPFTGVFACLSQVAERFQMRQQILEEAQSKSLEKGGVEAGRHTRLLHLQLRESEHLAEKLSQTVSDVTSILYLKEAEVQYWQSRVSHYRQEALRLAKDRNSLKATLCEYEFTMECQDKELAALHAEQKKLKGAVEEFVREKEELLQRWLKEKEEEADRMNEYNNTQERWQRLTEQLKKHLHKEKVKHHVSMATSSKSVTKETSLSKDP